MYENLNDLMFELSNRMENKQDDLAFINGKSYSISYLKSLTSNQLIDLLCVKPGDKLYKYCSFDGYAIENIILNQVHLSNPDDFDDTFDSRSDIGEEDFKRYLLEIYLDAINCKYSKESEVDELMYSLFSELGKIADTFDKFKEWLVESKISKILSLRLQNMYLSIIQGLKSPQETINDILHNDYIEYSNLVSKYRISCFSTNPINLKMWSLYANNNRGICIEYTVDANMNVGSLLSVVYSHIRGDYNYCLEKYDNMDNDSIFFVWMESLLRKDILWAEQSEYRLISASGLNMNDNVSFYPITAIYVGNKATLQDIDKIKGICRAKKIDCYHMQRDYKYYNLIPVKYK